MQIICILNTLFSWYEDCSTLILNMLLRDHHACLPQNCGEWKHLALRTVSSHITAAITHTSNSYGNQTEDIAFGSIQCTNWKRIFCSQQAQTRYLWKERLVVLLHGIYSPYSNQLPIQKLSFYGQSGFCPKLNILSTEDFQWNKDKLKTFPCTFLTFVKISKISFSRKTITSSQCSNPVRSKRWTQLCCNLVMTF